MVIKKVKLDYKPVAKCGSSKPAYKVPSSSVAAVARSIEQKVRRNEMEKKASEEVAARYVVKN